MDQFVNLFSSDDQQELKTLIELSLSSTERSQLWGHNIMPGLSAQSAKFAYEKWTVKANDVFVVTYPKTGTIFVGEILRRILYQDEKAAQLSKQIPIPLFFIEFGPEKKFDLIDKIPFERRLFGSHLPSDLINIEKIKEANAKIVYVLRNPKDQIVSWLNYAKKLPPGQEDPWKSMLNSKWEEYLEHVIAGDFDIHSKPGEWYPEHILSWYKHRDNNTLLFIYYEDLNKDPAKEIKKIAEFLKIALTEEKAKEIAEETSFDKMKQDESSSSNEVAKELIALNMRKGGVGGWKNHFTVSQSERIDAIMEEKLKDTDIKFTYE